MTVTLMFSVVSLWTSESSSQGWFFSCHALRVSLAVNGGTTKTKNNHIKNSLLLRHSRWPLSGSYKDRNQKSNYKWQFHIGGINFNITKLATQACRNYHHLYSWNCPEDRHVYKIRPTYIRYVGLSQLYETTMLWKETCRLHLLDIEETCWTYTKPQSWKKDLRLLFEGLYMRKRSNSSCWMGTCSVEL